MLQSHGREDMKNAAGGWRTGANLVMAKHLVQDPHVQSPIPGFVCINH